MIMGMVDWGSETIVGCRQGTTEGLWLLYGTEQQESRDIGQVNFRDAGQLSLCDLSRWVFVVKGSGENIS